MRYTIKTAEAADFSKAEVAHIDCYKWTSGYSPRAEARLLFIPKTGFALEMKAYESDPKTVYKQYNDPVYKDSCLEFFVSFAPDSGKYMNFEMNSAGAFLSAVRASRSDTTHIDKLAPLPHVTAEKGDGCWCVRVVFTLDFIEKTFGRKDFATGDIIKGNFYKCGDDTEYPHFGMWSPVELPAPDFHRPEFFGELVIE